MVTTNCVDVSKRNPDLCGCLPPGFSRLRYFYGKHLNVADFMDEQRYHMSKMRFHNQRLHGAGVLCGLRMSLLDPDKSIVRIIKGAALDCCGREIIVGYDQCIDVNGWYQHQRKCGAEPKPDPAPCPEPKPDPQPQPAPPDPIARHSDTYDDPNCPPRPCPEKPEDPEEKYRRIALCVVLRYKECPNHPEPAPRDPCACGEGGCEYGRITEGFELKLVPRRDLKKLAFCESFPTSDQIERALAESVTGSDLIRNLSGPITAGCPAGREDSWLLLGCFTAVLDNTEPPSIIRLENVGEGCAPPILLSTEVIQYLVAHLYADAKVDIGAPKITEVQWRRANQNYQLSLVLSGPLDHRTMDPDDAFRLRRLDESGWTVPGSYGLSSDYVPDHAGTGQPAIHVRINNSQGFLREKSRYQLYVNRELEPIVDSEIRQLVPHDFVWRFSLKRDESGYLGMVLPPF